MARWSRSRLRVFGIGAVAFLGGSLLAIPAVSQAEEHAAAARLARAAMPDRIAMVAGAKGLDRDDRRRGKRMRPRA